MRQAAPSKHSTGACFEHFVVRTWDLHLCLLCLLASVFATNAQVQLTHDPLMNLMLAQPQIDVDSPVTPVAAFDPPVIRPGQSSTYRVKINALEASIEWPDQIEAPNLSLREGGRAQILAPIGGKLQPHTTLNYHARVSQPGQYSFPAFTIQVYGKPVTIPAAQLSVVENPSGPVSPEQLLRFELAATNVYVGQPVRVRIALPSTPGTPIQPVGMVEINGQGFIVDQSSIRQQLGAIARPDGMGSMAGFIYETTLTPIATGTLTAFAQGIVGNRYTSGILLPSGPGGAVDYTLLDSEPMQLHVRPLPHEGQLPGFTGAFAPLSVETPNLSTNLLRVGDPVKLTVKIHGDPFNNLLRLVPPAAPESPEWQVLETTETPPPQQVQAQSFATFTYSLIPLTAKAERTPAIPFSCFDAERGVYRDISIASVPVEILPGSVPSDLAAIAKARAVDAAAEKEPVLSGLAAAPGLAARSLVPVQRQIWFPLIQLVPALSFFGLWWWDRRRRYLEQHPGIVRCRRARRALRRHWRAMGSAAQRGDAPRYAAAAVDALKVASAPHYPAQPQALVGADVLALLPLEERTGRAGEVIRRFFAVTDATRFGAASPDGQELLNLQPELERVLTKFDEQLKPGVDRQGRDQTRSQVC